MRPRRAEDRCVEGREIAIRQQIFDESQAGTRLFQRLPRLRGRRTGGAGVILRFERVRPRQRSAISAAQVAGDHARISRSDDPGAEALEIRYRLDGRGLPQGGHAGLAAAVRLPDIRRRLQGHDHVGLSGAVATCRALHRLRADRVSGRPRRGMVARAGRSDRARKSHQPGDGSQGAAFRYRQHREKYQLYEFLEGWMRSLAPPDLSSAIKDLCTRYSVDLAALSREASMDWDDLAKLAADPDGDDWKCDGELSRAVEPEGRGRVARDDDGQGGGARPRFSAMSSISPIRSAIARPFAAQHVAMAAEAGFASAASAISGRRRGRGPDQSARASAHRLGRTAAFAARHARDSLGHHLSRRRTRPRAREILGVRPRHPADDRHRRQHPADAGHDIEDRLQQPGIRQPRRLRHRHSHQRPHHDQHAAGRWFRRICGCVWS